MTIVNDESVFNDASSQSNWTASDFDSSTDNDINASPSIYREGSVCQQWILKENITDGYVYTSTLGGTKDISNGEIVIFWFFITADADLDKLSKMRLRVSSDTGFTTNYAEWDVEDQIYGLDYYGWFPIAIYPSNPTAIAGTVVYSSIDSIGWVASTGTTGTKLSGFDQSHSVKYLGGHSETVTLTDLYDDSITNDLGVVLKFSNFFKFQVNIRLGGVTNVNMVFNESDKQLFFDNIQADHNLGFIFVDNTSGTNTFDIDGWSISWNEQTGTSPQILTDPEHCDIFRVANCTFARGGDFECRAWISDANTYIKNTSFSACYGSIKISDILFEDNTITGMTLGAEYTIATDGSRASGTRYTNNTTALKILTVGTYTLDGDLFSGNTYDIENADNASTITAGSFIVGRGYKILVPGTTDFTLIGASDSVIGTKFVATGIGTGTGTATEVLVVSKTNGANPTTVNNTGTNSDTLLVASFVLTLTGLVSGIDVTIVNSSTRVELKHEVLSGTTATYTHGGGETVDILLNSTLYDPNLSDIYDLTLPNADSSIKFQLLDDLNYSNP